METDIEIVATKGHFTNHARVFRRLIHEDQLQTNKYCVQKVCVQMT